MQVPGMLREPGRLRLSVLPGEGARAPAAYLGSGEREPSGAGGPA